MKLSVSIPDSMAKEIKDLADQSERPVSWWFQQAWDVARTKLLRGDRKAANSHRRFMKTLDRLTGSLRESYPDIDSVTLAHRAFELKKR